MDNKIDTIKTPAQTSAGTPDDTIDLVEIFYLMLEHFWQILLSLLAGAILAFSVTWFLITPTYTATAQLYIVSASNDSVVNLSDLQVGSQLTADYRELMLSRPILEDVIDNLSLEMGYQQLAGMITITNSSDTRILKVSVTGADPKEAAAIANELTEQAIDFLPKIMECDEPNLVEEAIVPAHKSGPSYSKNVMLGALGGAVLYCGILLIRYLMNDTFVTPDDIERYFGVRPLASVPEGNLEGFNSKKKKHKKWFRFLKKQKNGKEDGER